MFFTTQEVVAYCLVAFLFIGVVVGLLLYAVKRLMARKQNNGEPNKFGIGKSVLIGLGLVAAVIILFFVAPTMVKDNNWNRKQQSCAKQVGYQSPGDDNSGHATAESQVAYRDCLYL